MEVLPVRWTPKYGSVPGKKGLDRNNQKRPDTLSPNASFSVHMKIVYLEVTIWKKFKLFSNILLYFCTLKGRDSLQPFYQGIDKSRSFENSERILFDECVYFILKEYSICPGEVGIER